MGKGKDKFYFKLLQRKGRTAKPLDSTLQLMRKSGANLIMVSKSGSGVVYMKGAKLGVRRAAQGTKFDALLQREDADKVYGVANGVLFVVDDPQASAQIREASSEPVANFEFVEIQIDQLDATLQGATDEQERLNVFRASVKRGYRGGDIAIEGRRMSSAELDAAGWQSSISN